jgi:hypothetical protein
MMKLSKTRAALDEKAVHKTAMLIQRQTRALIRKSIRDAVERSVPTEKELRRLKEELERTVEYAETLGEKLDEIKSSPAKLLADIMSIHAVELVERAPGKNYNRRSNRRVISFDYDDKSGMFLLVISS